MTMTRNTLAWLITMILGCAAQLAAADSVRVLDAMVCEADAITLADVAELEGERATALAEVVVARFDAAQRERKVTIDQVRGALDAEGVNWGFVSLRGYTTCVVQRRAVEAEPIVADRVAPVLANPGDAVTLTTAFTVRDEVTAFLERINDVDRGILEFGFAQRVEAFLDAPLGQARIEIEHTSKNTLGRVPLVVRQYRGDHVLLDEQHLLVDVAQPVLAVVATRPVGRGQTITSRDVEIAEVMWTDSRSTPLTDKYSVVGQTAAMSLREGAPVRETDLRSPVIVQRGAYLTVRAVVGELVVLMPVKAMDAGAMGEVIKVRNEASRETLLVRVTGSRQAALLNGSSNPDEPATDTEHEQEGSG